MPVGKRVVAASLLPAIGLGDPMDCRGAPLCGVLTLESGLGSGYYTHTEPSVHGLWPQTGQYGTSQCIAPQDTSDINSIPSCYDNAEAKKDPTHQLEFVNHEWEKHGVCAGVKDVQDFFTQICSISKAPLALMTTRKDNGGNFNDLVEVVQDAGYEVFATDTENAQLELSACACSDGQWKLAKVSEFASKCCGGSSPSPSPTPTPSPPSPTPAGQCLPSTHGPACSSDADCQGVPGCVRCAHSGYCTDVPIAVV